MAVIETTRRGGSTEQTSAITGPSQHTVKRERRSFRVTEVSSKTEAVAAAGVPALDAPHPDDATLLLTRQNAEALAPSVYEVICEYEFRGVPGAIVPTDEPPNIVWGSTLVDEPCFFDINDKQIVLPSGEAPDTPSTRSYSLATLEYTFNSPVFDANIIFTHLGRVNAAQWSTNTTGIVPAGCAMLRSIRAPLQWQGVTPYFRITYEFSFRSQFDKAGAQKGFKLRLLNAGFLYKDAATGKLENVKVGGIPTRVPMLLSEDGTRYYKDGKGPGEPDPANPNFVEFDILRSADFGVLEVI